MRVKKDKKIHHNQQDRRNSQKKVIIISISLEDYNAMNSYLQNSKLIAAELFEKLRTLKGRNARLKENKRG